MHYRLLRFIPVFLLLAFAATDVHAQKRSKKHVPRVHSATPSTQSSMQPRQAADLSSPAPNVVPVPQQGSFTPEMKKTKKVVIVPAPPPPPGPDPVPAYPKR
jgi:hypothetical protein